MNLYRLKYHEDGIGRAKEIAFDAPTSAQALFIAQREAMGRTAELWRDDMPLCTLRRVSERGDYWVINGAPDMLAESRAEEDGAPEEAGLHPPDFPYVLLQ